MKLVCSFVLCSIESLMLKILKMKSSQHANHFSKLIPPNTEGKDKKKGCTKFFIWKNKYVVQDSGLLGLYSISKSDSSLENSAIVHF